MRFFSHHLLFYKTALSLNCLCIQISHPATVTLQIISLNSRTTDNFHQSGLFEFKSCYSDPDVRCVRANLSRSSLSLLTTYPSPSHLFNPLILDLQHPIPLSPSLPLRRLSPPPLHLPFASPPPPSQTPQIPADD
ncbi:hypothetical protein Droror1_Dr00016629 [Drosera rotundifolia]